MTAAIRRLADAEGARLLRFCQVGVLNTAITVIVFAVLVRCGVPAWASSALAFGVGAANGYVCNARWTFAGRSSGARRERARYVAVQALGSAVSAAGVGLVHGLLGLAHLPAELAIIPLVTALTYTLVRRAVFPAVSLPVGSVSPA